MKINEKNLAAFATSTTPIDREGWLVKRGEMNKGYQKRWFVLKGNLLFYFEKRGDREPVGVIVLEGCTIELAEDEEQFGFKIVFHGAGNRNYLLGADCQESMEGWMKALACAGYDFMKLMVAELQRQLDDLEECGHGIPMLGAGCDLPQVPPRQRHNPFNRLDETPPQSSSPAAGISSTHHRSQSMRAGNARAAENIHKPKVTFHELHAAYGQMVAGSRIICQQRTSNNNEELLITL